MFDADDFNRKLKQHRAAVAKVNALNKVAVFDVLSAAGITQIDVTFDGELRRSRKMTHFCSVRVTHLKNKISV